MGVKALLNRLDRYREDAPVKRESLCRGIVGKVFTDLSSPAAQAAITLLSDIIDFEGFLSVPAIDLAGRKFSTGEVWENRRFEPHSCLF
jgi:hypothetical protein